ncbi:branched-chain amino acid ABC transporter permease [uncultured Xylophilus sp.]|uniref:branched-chain amino acid ABC transporter permease n=1 Tax=uncultured Xylophilus sp. TaxID=296832 RepID=UPI0025D5A7FC|nr:branched-chain amino acid ABC transporter permease [uncultured Xylophilus sp.]
MFTLLFDGLAYGMLLFVLSLGLSVTLGLMNFVNLAHGAFAMAGGYIAVAATRQAGLPFLAGLGCAFTGTGLLALALERTLYRRMYRRPHLDQVLLTIGLAFMAVAATTWWMGPSQQTVVLPAWLRGRTEIGAGPWQLAVGHYRLFVAAVCGVLALGLQLLLRYSRFGMRLRAAVEDTGIAAALGIDVDRIFLVTFCVGSGLAGLGGALAVEPMGLDPSFALKHLALILVVVAVGGTATVAGPLAAALLLGVADVMGKYWLPQAGAFTVYALAIGVLLWRPHGLLARRGGA